MDRLFVVVGGLFGLTGVGLGAIGAHLLEGRLPADRLSSFQLAGEYQIYHALALLAVAWAVARWTHPALVAAGWLFIGGIILFSGSIYVLTLGGPRWVGPVTPLGGMALMAGWGLLIWGAWRGAVSG